MYVRLGISDAYFPPLQTIGSSHLFFWGSVPGTIRSVDVYIYGVVRIRYIVDFKRIPVALNV